ncbi:ATP-binding cassette domain-containing protein [Cuneatibacter caecimuris]|uniref:NitT/TauT family transport system ATP-binding protein n=1 Tax=Cuneatibacter caecimuris TaxID=1796618 RepID=A0A4Q7PUK5_9FIRM|nr:ATP-binding cassette domain-containing protein [Cuneatibacter caecimuris]RZT03010.1 NitT/TauT family transport system ATP-binding protein [Cuneatibacter caecimuris]
MIEIRHLEKRFGETEVFSNLNFRLEDGGRYCLMGASGRGKTTLLRCILGLEKPDTGEIMKSDPNLSAVFQEDRLVEFLSPVDNVLLALSGGRSRAERKALAVRALAEILPQDCLYQPCRELSGGMRRRVAVCRAMLAESSAVLMDEPFSGLDEDNHSRLLQWVLREQRGRILLLSSHDPEDAEALGGNVITI